ncbi:bifunctional cytochrome P450/NADPH--P450 reductase CypB [Streptomyces coacervatus]|uniref:Bifunctional cytochrome P450/NADPH--P450 reductase n=1 Tax=Streptomyces coacervatus TaxID=647381 RepID=A0ABP7IWI4_9ACTN|nr:cytochrome P450 [Streptomyces coacervatus]MDF2269718.1 cytochrome P450 [Streptomyces coacervatus]
MTEVILPPHTEMRDGLPVVDLATSPLPAGPPVLANMERARTYGPAYFQRFGGFDVLFAGGLDLVTELADEQRFTKFVGPALVNVREFAGDGLFTAFNDEPNWAKAHDLLMPAFALGSMRRYHPVMLRVAHRLLDTWDRRAAAGTPVDVADDMTRMTLDTIGLAGFGFDFGSFDSDRPHPFVGAMVRCLTWAMTKTGRKPDVDYGEVDEAFRADADYLASVVDEVIAARTAVPQPEADDLLGLMLSARHPSDGTTLDKANIRNQVITFLIAGHETTSGTLAFALYFLSQHPEVLHRVQREVDELWGDVADPEPTYEDVGRLRYTRQVLNETLRLWPAAPGFGRQALKDTVIGDGVRMRAGQPALVSVPMLHRDPVWGDNPDLFDPSRFDPEAEAARSPHAFKPFGTGERACIGRQFALHEATMLLGMLAHRYRLIDHARYQLTIKQTLTIKPDGFTLNLIPRTPGERAARSPEITSAPAADSSLPARVKQGTGLLVLHGSNYGACRDFAVRLAASAGELGCETEVAPLDTYADALPVDRPLIIAAASYNGQPTDDAAAFVRWLETAEPGAADGVTYAVLGIGDRNWAATYQRIPTFIDRRLAELGGTRLLERAEGDASGDLAGAVRQFTDRMRTALLDCAGDPASVGASTESSGYLVTEVLGRPLDALAARHGMTAMTVTEARSLTEPDYPRVKRFVRVELPPDQTYRTADHFAVLPANAPALVERAAKLLGADLETVLNITSARPRPDGLALDRPLTVRELLTHHVELQDRPTADQLRTLAAVNPCPPEQRALVALADDEQALTADPRTLLDVIEDNPALSEALNWPVVLDLLPPIRPRTYSVSSSPATAPGHAELMVSLLEAPARSGRGIHRGTGSGHLNAVQPGDVVLARLQPCREAFRIMHDDRTPVIMIAAGTGLAPFRGAIADRRTLAEAGTRLAPALCYFGCDGPDVDYLHAEELRAAEAAGVVSMRPVFSEKPENGLRFVQHRITTEADEVWQLLEAGARVYVCGDGRHMAPGVRDAFRSMYTQRTPGADGTAAEEWLRNLMDQNRYIEDVYAG